MGKDNRRSQGPGQRGLTEEEERLWRLATESVKPGKKAPPPTAGAPAAKPGKPAGPRSTAAAKPAVPPILKSPKHQAQPSLHPHATPAGLDKRNAERLRRGQMAIDARIDLHGMTQAQAHSALNAFLARAQAGGARCVIVVTGKGIRRPDSDFDSERGFMPERSRGVLRDMVPRWLNEPTNRARIVAVQQAQPKHGGGGALYVLLKKLRPAP